jgi:hypothetical protein
MSKKTKKWKKQEQNSKKTIIKMVLQMLVLAFIFTVIFILLLTPNVREISFFYSGCTATITDTDISNHKMKVTAICQKKNLDSQQMSQNVHEIKSKNIIAEQIATFHLPLINSIRFKFEATNNSTARYYSSVDPTKFDEASATITCNIGGQKIRIKQGEHFPVNTVKADFLTLAETEKFYTDLDQQIQKQCTFASSVDQKIQIRSASSTEPIMPDAVWVGEAGAEMDMKTVLKESYTTQLYMTGWSKFFPLYHVLRYITWNKWGMEFAEE